MNRHREIVEAVRDVATRAGASVIIEEQGRHPRAILHFQGQHRFIVLSRTPSDGRAPRMAAHDARRALRQLGASI